MNITYCDFQVSTMNAILIAYRHGGEGNLIVMSDINLVIHRILVKFHKLFGYIEDGESEKYSEYCHPT